MRFAFISGGGTLWLWQALRDEGHEVAIFHNQKDQEGVGRGMGFDFVPSISALVAWAGRKGIIICDLTKMPKDKVNPGLTTQALHKGGFFTVGGGEFAEKLECDREFGQKIAKDIGFKLPNSKAFNTLSDAIDFLYDHADRGWHFKTDKYLEAAATFGGKGESLIRHLEYLAQKYGDKQACHVEETIEGPALSVNAWFDGKEIVYPTQFTIEHKGFLNGDLGPKTGCSFNFCGPLSEDLTKRFHFDKLAQALRDNKALAGLYDMNTIVAEDGPYFLEWTPRFGYDSEATLISQIEDKGNFFASLAAGILDRTPWWGYSFGVRVSVPPYPTENFEEKSNAKNVPVIGPVHSSRQFAPYGLGQSEELETSVEDPGGIVGVALDSRPIAEPIEANEEILKFIREELDIPNLQYRTDSGLAIAVDLAELKRIGVNL